MTVNTIAFPSDLEILMTREFDAPIELVFDVFTKEEHVRNTFPRTEERCWGGGR